MAAIPASQLEPCKGFFSQLRGCPFRTLLSCIGCCCVLQYSLPDPSRSCCSICGGHLRHGSEAGPFAASGQPLSAHERVPHQQHQVQDPRADLARTGESPALLQVRDCVLQYISCSTLKVVATRARRA